LATWDDSWTWRLISLTDEVNSSLAEATACTLVGGFLGRCRDHRRKSCDRSAVIVSVFADAFQLGGGRRYHLDNFTDRAFECVGELVHIRLAQL